MSSLLLGRFVLHEVPFSVSTKIGFIQGEMSMGLLLIPWFI